MTLQTVLAWSIGRSLLITSLAIPVSWLIVFCVRDGRLSFGKRRWLTAAAMVPLFVPDLLIGFTYRLSSQHLVHSVAATEGLYGLLLLFRVTALQVAVSLILRSSTVSRESLHSWKLLRQNTFAWWSEWIRLLVRGPFRTPLVAWIGGALVCFQEFETAALLQIDRHPIAWTVWLFDAHAAGEPLGMSLSFVTWSMLFQTALLLPAILLLRSRRGGQVAAADLRGRPSRPLATPIPLISGIVICGSLTMVLFWPVASNGLALISGFRSLVASESLWSRSEQVAWSLPGAATASILALLLCVWIRSLRWSLLTLVCLVPGLCGSLVLSLVLLAAFQLPWLNPAYDSWVPMLLGQTLLMLPRAFLLVVLLDVTSAQTALHSGTLLTAASDRRVAATARNVEWRLGRFRWLLAAAVLTHWCLWDVTTASTLRSVGFEPVVTRLYNEMHYGRTETLVGITLLALLIPAVAFTLAGILWKRCPLHACYD